MESLFAAKRADDWARLAAVEPPCALVVGNTEAATRAAIDAMVTADVLITGSGSHLPDVCQGYLATRPAVRINVWAPEVRAALAHGELPQSVLRALAQRFGPAASGPASATAKEGE